MKTYLIMFRIMLIIGASTTPKTMHCGMLDSVESLCETALEKTLNYLLDGLFQNNL